jgi:hypothetical protein
VEQSNYRRLRVFLSSPKDVAEEREIARQAVESVSTTCKDALGIGIDCVTWEDFAPQAPKLPEERIQDILNNEIPRCQVFILILWKRYGSIEAGHRKSNTEREVEIALDLLKREKKIMFLTYFRDLPEGDDIGPQQRSVANFRDSLTAKGVWFRHYTAPSELSLRLTHDLFQTLLRYRFSTRKHAALSRFWVFGTPDRPTFPNLAIVYPSMNRTFMGPQEDSALWLNRLEPNIVFEDFKALQKLEKTLRIVGFRDFRIFNTSDVPVDLQYMNRFWICLRNTRLLEQAAEYKHVSRFELVRKENRAASYIRWKPCRGSRPSIMVRSPLAAYLREQRSALEIHGEWRPEMDRIIAKDFAVLARFRDTRQKVAMEDHYLQDYFLAGLRGLGTWGAAWFIDRKYEAFERLEDKQDFQFLLEVEYRNGRIFDVRDVSDEPQSYFHAENRISLIKKNIARFREP